MRAESRDARGDARTMSEGRIVVNEARRDERGLRAVCRGVRSEESAGTGACALMAADGAEARARR